MSALPQEQTPCELQVYRRYLELGVIERNAKAERENVRKEIDEMVTQGILLGENGRGLKLRYDTKLDFDWKTAVGEKAIPQEVFEKYAKVKVIPVLADGNMDEEEAADQARINLIRGAAVHLYNAILSGDAELIQNAIDLAEGKKVKEKNS